MMLTVNEDRCVGCGLCVSFCPRDALKAWGLCRIDRDACNDCLICPEYCPVDALVVVEEVRA
jgi:NAD-dependent dihydropyrimidine dehydrogenase PreA subunit